MSDKTIILSDPVHGFVEVPRKISETLLETPEVQRLRRIKQLGVGVLVYPTASHNRLSHSLGAMSLLSNALDHLVSKGTPISEEERLAACAAILLHDIGHGPYSHVLEKSLINVDHERISLEIMQRLESRVKLPLNMAMAIRMLGGVYERSFFHHLISSQLDMDRLDYLRRDSHLTGVVEGGIGTEWILRNLCVHPVEGGPGSCLAIESKGIEAIESFLITRRLMYWRVYLHKTILAAGSILKGAMKRARYLIHYGDREAVDGISPALYWFLKESKDQGIPLGELNEKALDQFLKLDDAGITHSLSSWCDSTDPILADLSRRIIERKLFHCTFLDEKSEDKHQIWEIDTTQALRKIGITDSEAHTYYLEEGQAKHEIYKPNEESISVMKPSGELVKLDQYVDEDEFRFLSSFVEKRYICHLKDVRL